MMFAGALTTSLKLHPYLGFFLLSFGNAFWAGILLSMKEYAASSVFIIMFVSWFIGLVYYFL